MALGRRAVVFTLMAVVVASVIIVSVEVLERPEVRGQDTQLLRAGVVNDIVTSFEDYARSSLRVSTYSSLDRLSEVLWLEDDDNMTLFYADDEELVGNVRRCVFDLDDDLELSGAPISADCLARNETLLGLLDGFEELVADSFGVSIEYSLDEEYFILEDASPFIVEARIAFEEFTISDETASWHIEDHNVSVFVSLTGVQDPLTGKVAHSHHSSGFDAYRFVRTDIGVWNRSSTLDFVGEETFRFTSDPIAPSALQRYYSPGSSSGCCGVEALISGTRLNASSWPHTLAPGDSSTSANYSYVDHELLVSEDDDSFAPLTYPCSGGGVQVYAIEDSQGRNSKTYFWLDSASLDRYNVSVDSWLSC